LNLPHLIDNIHITNWMVS